MPLVSVIMNIRNGAVFLHEALDSRDGANVYGLGADSLGRLVH